MYRLRRSRQRAGPIAERRPDRRVRGGPLRRQNEPEPLPPRIPGQRLILANLPYIPSARIETLAVAAAEPRFALDGGPDGFDRIRELLAGIRGKVVSPFLILCEIDDAHAEIAANFSRPLFPSARIAIETDYAGENRFLRIEG